MRNNNPTRSNSPIVLIVDDMPENLRILSELLKENGYRVRPVPNGNLALQVAEKEKPDLILLDIMMPDMDGYEVCSLLKANENLKDVPVIFISALNDAKDIVKAFTSGGVDYVTKPFKAEEVTARVATHLKIRWQNQELLKLNTEKDKFFSIIAHDLRSPFGGFIALTEMMADEVEDFLPGQQKELMTDLKHSAQNVYDLLNDLLEWSKMQRGLNDFNPQMLGLKNEVTDCLKIVSELARKKSIEISSDISDSLEVYADTNMLQTILRNLTTNAIKFTPLGGRVIISSVIDDSKQVVISVEDNGIGMTSKMLDDLFHIDAKTGRPGTEGESSSGLGLILCKEFIEKHGGNIWVESELQNLHDGKQGGSTFCFTLPPSKT